MVERAPATGSAWYDGVQPGERNAMTSPSDYPWEDCYVDDGSQRPQDDVTPEDFARMQDRAPLTGRGSPFFSGREAQINEFRECAGQLAKGVFPNNTIVVDGPPGCGKTALLDQITADINSYSADRNGREWLPVFINGNRATDPAAIMASVDETIAKRLSKKAAERPGGRALARLQEFLDISDTSAEKGKRTAATILDRGFSVGGFRVGAKNERQPRDIEDAIAMRGPKWGGWNIVLLVDEAQQIHNPNNTKTSTLSSIHQGVLSFPIMFAAFGLVGTREALASVGVSRPLPSRKFALGAMSNEDARKACVRAVRQLKPPNPDQVVKAVLERSWGWPQHIASYLTAAAESLKEQDTSAMLAAGDLIREDYYEDRLLSLTSRDPEFVDYAKALAGWILGANRPVEGSNIIKQVQLHFGAERDAAVAFLRAAEHAGIVRKADRGTYTAAIPSFLTYLIGEERAQERTAPDLGRHLPNDP